MTKPSRIDNILADNAPKQEAPQFIGHLLVLPLTDGSEATMDPEEISGMSQHRSDVNVTVVRKRDDDFTYFVDRPYELVKQWVAEALSDL